MKTLRGLAATAVWIIGMPVVMWASMALATVGRGDPDEGHARVPVATVGGVLVFVVGFVVVLVLSGRVARWRRLADPPLEHLPPGH